MKKEYRFVLLIQLYYILIAMFVALVLWTALPDAVGEVKFSVNQWKFSGAFGGFAFVWLFLRRRGVIESIMKDAAQPIQAGILLTPARKEEYNVLFDGFTDCDFYAFNPPFKVEGEPGDHLFHQAVATHAKRYRDGGVRSRYLFFDGASYERASVFFRELAKETGENMVKECIKSVHWQNAPRVPGYTFFIGHKKGKSFCIFYPSAAVREGIPEAIIFIDGAKDFLKILRNHFLQNWDQATAS